jgi:hypothetical protein
MFVHTSDRHIHLYIRVFSDELSVTLIVYKSLSKYHKRNVVDGCDRVRVHLGNRLL